MPFMAVRSGLIGHGLHDLEYLHSELSFNHRRVQVGVLKRVMQPSGTEHVQVRRDAGIGPVADEHAHDLLEVTHIRFIGVQLLAVTGNSQCSGSLENLL
jgi:hypothetical protein